MAKNSIKKITKKMWSSIIAGGIFSIIFGLLAMFWPGLTIATIVLMFGIFLIITSIVWMFEALSSIKSDPLWWLGLLFAILGAGAGAYLLCNPETLIQIFVVLFAVYIFIQSLIDLIVASYTERTSDKTMWILLGILGIAFGIVIVIHPIATSLTFVWALGVYALTRGLLSEIFAFRMRKSLRKAPKAASKTKKKK